MKNLKGGDTIEVELSTGFYNATVIDNFPNAKEIFLNVRMGFVCRFKTLRSYDSSCFKLLNLRISKGA